MKILITGGLGILGSEVAHQLIAQGHEVAVLDLAENTARIDSIREEVELIHADISKGEELQDLFRTFNPEQVFHFAAVLGPVSEEEPEKSFHANVAGTRNVFEAARSCGARQLLFASSTGTFGGAGGVFPNDDSPQRPGIIYGWEKLYGEGLVSWYRNRYKFDCRGLRYAQVVGPNCDAVCWLWASGMIEDAVLRRNHTSASTNPDRSCGFLYIRDAGRAALELLAAPAESVKGTYNVNGLPGLVCAGDLEKALNRRYPGFSVSYAGPPSGRDDFRGWDDSRARRDWNWKAEWSDLDSLLDQFERDLCGVPERFGLNGKSSQLALNP